MRFSEIARPALREDQTLRPAQISALAEQGFDTKHPLYHGTDADLTRFDRSFARTANDIYTSPDRETASAYGRHLYVVFGKTDKCADLTENYELLGKLADTFKDDFTHAVEHDEDVSALADEIRSAYDDPYDCDVESDPRYQSMLERAAKNYVIELLQGGEMYTVSRGFQDAVMQECFALGYTSVFMHDRSHTGAWESMVFHDPTDLVIVRKIY